MNPKSTWRWLIVAAVLCAAIVLHKKFAPKKETGPIQVLPGLKAAEINSIEVLPKGHSPILAERGTNGLWRLVEPAYPAQSLSIEFLLAGLQQLTATTFIPEPEFRKITDADQQFGFDPPQASLLIGRRNFHVLVGDKTAPGDGVYVQVVSSGGVYVVDANLLKLIPQKAADWRDTALVNWGELKFDRLIVTNAGKILELQRNPTNQLWRMLLPLPARANSAMVDESLLRLQALRAHGFESDDPKADLEAYGIQSPDLTLAFFLETNTVLTLNFGKSPTNNAELAFARRDELPNIVTVPTNAFQPWLAASSHEFRDFLDHHLVALTRVPDSVEIVGTESFTLERQTNETWRVMPQDFAADMTLMQEFINHLTNLKFKEIEREIVLDQDLPAYGLKPPSRQYVFRNADTNAVDGATNAIAAQLDFGIQDDKVYARTKGEDFVYAVDPADANFRLLPTAGWQMRDRRIWEFSTNDVVRITLRQGGKTLEMLRYGPGSWGLAAGSQGDINPFAIEAAAHGLGDLFAVNWAARGDAERARFGFTPDGHQVTVELKGGRKLTLEFGGAASSGLPYALAQVDGEPWIFEFPPLLYYRIVLPYLTIKDRP